MIIVCDLKVVLLVFMVGYGGFDDWSLCSVRFGFVCDVVLLKVDGDEGGC
jgi:hypothetical protein